MLQEIAYRWLIVDTRDGCTPGEQAILAVAMDEDSEAGFLAYRAEMWPHADIVDAATWEIVSRGRSDA